MRIQAMPNRGAPLACVLLMTAVHAAAGQQPQVMRSTASGAWGSDLRVIEEVRIGALEGEEHYVFGRIGAVAVGRDGAIHVADTQVPIIRIYDSRGRFVRNIGREGAGPGEYRAIAGMRTFPDGRIAVWDNRNVRITIYTASGDHAATHPVASGLFAADIFEVDQLGYCYVRTVIRAGRPGEGQWDEGWIRVAPDGKVLDTIPIPRDPDRPESFVLATASGYDRPFTTELVTRLSPLGYLITGRNDTYAFELNRSDAPGLRIERQYTPVRLSRQERAEWQAWAGFFERRTANPTSPSPNFVLPPPRRVSFRIPDVKPAYSELRTDSRGRIWVRRYVAAQQRPGPERPPGDARPRRVWREPPTYDVFEPTGQFLGTVTLPWDSYFFDAVDRHVWVSVRGEYDEAYVVRLRVESRTR